MRGRCMCGAVRFEFASERSIDRKPPNFAFVGEHETLSAAEVAATYAGGGS